MTEPSSVIVNQSTPLFFFPSPYGLRTKSQSKSVDDQAPMLKGIVPACYAASVRLLHLNNPIYLFENLWNTGFFPGEPGRIALLGME